MAIFPLRHSQKLRNRKNANYIFGFDNDGFVHYKRNHGQQVMVDVAGWIDESYDKFQYPEIEVEIMMSSNLRDQISNHGQAQQAIKWDAHSSYR